MCLDFNVGIEEEPAIRTVARDGCVGKLPLITVVSDNSLLLNLPLQVLSPGNKDRGVEKGEREPGGGGREPCHGPGASFAALPKIGAHRTSWI